MVSKRRSERRLDDQHYSRSASLSPPAATTPSLSAVCDFEQSLCGWSADPQSGVSWSLHTASSSSTGHGAHGTRQDLALGSDSEYRFVCDSRHILTARSMKCIRQEALCEFSQIKSNNLKRRQNHNADAASEN